ncbi:MAG: glutamate racemase [Candidatus Omnitrophica bacterium]|nr:glutamate racemase [Candidatus Omnitrophota bacterium]
MDRNSAVGVFDSGLGGLTVVKEMLRLLPKERIVYFGDTARVPYGTKSRSAIVRFSRENTELLLSRDVKMVVVACNSSSSYAIPVLKKHYPVPVLGVIEPGARKAAAVTRNNRIGVIATAATINSGQYTRNILKYNPDAQVISQPCALFVPLVEEGWLDTAATRQIALEYLAPLKEAGVDTVILGCTHYPLLREVIQRTMGTQVTLVDSATEIAVRVRELLGRSDMLRVRGRAVPRFYVSDKPQEFGRIAKNFLGRELKAAKITQGTGHV